MGGRGDSHALHTHTRLTKLTLIVQSVRPSQDNEQSTHEIFLQCLTNKKFGYHNGSVTRTDTKTDAVVRRGDRHPGMSTDRQGAGEPRRGFHVDSGVLKGNLNYYFVCISKLCHALSR